MQPGVALVALDASLLLLWAILASARKRRPDPQRRTHARRLLWATFVLGVAASALPLLAGAGPGPSALVALVALGLLLAILVVERLLGLASPKESA